MTEGYCRFLQVVATVTNGRKNYSIRFESGNKLHANTKKKKAEPKHMHIWSIVHSYRKETEMDDIKILRASSHWRCLDRPKAPVERRSPLLCSAETDALDWAASDQTRDCGAL